MNSNINNSLGALDSGLLCLMSFIKESFRYVLHIENFKYFLI